MVLVLLTVFLFNSTSAWSATHRFIDFGEGALLDSTTGLYWLKNTDAYGMQGVNAARSFPGVLSSGQCGLTDGSVAGQWRLPNSDELFSLVDAPDNYRINDLRAAGFQNVGGVTAGDHSYWSSIQTWEDARLMNDFLSTFEGSIFSDYDDRTALIWPVRDFFGGVLTVSPSPASLGPAVVNTTSASQTITLRNIGTVDLIVSDISILSGDSAMFTLDTGDGTGGTCGDTPTLAASAMCTVSATYTSQEDGVKSTILRVSSNSHKAPTTDTVLLGNAHEPSVAWWKGENDATDSVGSNDGTASAAENAYAPGQHGQAFNFDGGSAQWVSVPHSESLNIFGTHTVSFWVKLNALPPSGQYYYLASKLVSGVENKLVTVDSDGKLLYYLHGTSATSGVQSTTSLSMGEWTHVAATYNAITQNIYINGTLDASIASTGDVVDGLGVLYLGYSPDWGALGVAAHFNGLLDDVTWDNRTLSYNDIAMFAKISPDPFVLTAAVDMPRNTSIMSAPVAVTGIRSITCVEIDGGEYSISNNGGISWGDWTKTAGVVFLDDMVRVRVASSAAYDTTTAATLAIGGVSSVFEVTTAKLGDPNADSLVSWWRAEGNVNDAVRGNDGSKGASFTTTENNPISVVLPTGTVTSYMSTYGAGTNWVDCGMCTVGDDSCGVMYAAFYCGDPAPGVAKTGRLSVFNDAEYVPGKVGQAFDFSTDKAKWIAVPYSLSLDIGTEHTVSFWIKLNALPTVGNAFYPVRKHMSDAEHKQVSIGEDGRVTYFLHGTGSPGVTSAKAVSVGEWTHVTATYDGAAMKVYLNGVLDGSVPASGSVANSVGIVYLANSPDVFNDPFTGQLDEVKWFNETLSAGDVFQSVYGNGVPVDTDSDGIDDSWEQTNFGDLTTATATSDYDEDGYLDLQEYQNNKAIVSDPDGVAFDPKRANAPNDTGDVGGVDLTPVLMLLSD